MVKPLNNQRQKPCCLLAEVYYSLIPCLDLYHAFFSPSGLFVPESSNLSPEEFTSRREHFIAAVEEFLQQKFCLLRQGLESGEITTDHMKEKNKIAVRTNKNGGKVGRNGEAQKKLSVDKRLLSYKDQDHIFEKTNTSHENDKNLVRKDKDLPTAERRQNCDDRNESHSEALNHNNSVHQSCVCDDKILQKSLGSEKHGKGNKVLEIFDSSFEENVKDVFENEDSLTERISSTFFENELGRVSVLREGDKACVNDLPDLMSFEEDTYLSLDNGLSKGNELPEASFLYHNGNRKTHVGPVCTPGEGQPWTSSSGIGVLDEGFASDFLAKAKFDKSEFHEDGECQIVRRLTRSNTCSTQKLSGCRVDSRKQVKGKIEAKVDGGENTDNGKKHVTSPSKSNVLCTNQVFRKRNKKGDREVKFLSSDSEKETLIDDRTKKQKSKSEQGVEKDMKRLKTAKGDSVEQKKGKAAGVNVDNEKCLKGQVVGGDKTKQTVKKGCSEVYKPRGRPPRYVTKTIVKSGCLKMTLEKVNRTNSGTHWYIRKLLPQSKPTQNDTKSMKHKLSRNDGGVETKKIRRAGCTEAVSLESMKKCYVLMKKLDM